MLGSWLQKLTVKLRTNSHGQYTGFQYIPGGDEFSQGIPISLWRDMDATPREGILGKTLHHKAEEFHHLMECYLLLLLRFESYILRQCLAV